jgi:hypothetical protein
MHSNQSDGIASHQNSRGILGGHESTTVDMATGQYTADIGTAESKIGMEMVAQRNETEKPEGLSERPERGNHPIKYF